MFETIMKFQLNFSPIKIILKFLVFFTRFPLSLSLTLSRRTQLKISADSKTFRLLTAAFPNERCWCVPSCSSTLLNENFPSYFRHTLSLFFFCTRRLFQGEWHRSSEQQALIMGDIKTAREIFGEIGLTTTKKEG